ncbi:uncharacterized protein LOC142322156 [Lycorma delicatula]|uniref:uncharacterized protein LOC142322156 n=1 Tax=Lycorma delicatula TaxID=130591 RepID=UPI003F515244
MVLKNLHKSNMAESAIEVAVNPPTSNILTEEMIDAAMSQRLSMEVDLIHHGGIDNDHNYCGGDDESSGSDFQVETVSDDDDYNSSETIIPNVAIKKCDIELIKNNEVEEEEKKISENSINSNCETVTKSTHELNKPEGNYTTKININLLSAVSDNSVNSVNNDTNAIGSNSSDHVASDININNCVSHIKQSLSIKPLSNLLKDDLIVKENSVRIFKCIQGRIELSGLEESDDKTKPVTSKTSVNNNLSNISIDPEFSHKDSENNVNSVSLVEEISNEISSNKNIESIDTSFNKQDSSVNESKTCSSYTVPDCPSTSTSMSGEVLNSPQLGVTVESKNKEISSLLMKSHEGKIMNLKANNENDKECLEIPLLKSTASKDGLDPVNKSCNDNTVIGETNESDSESADASSDKNIDKTVTLPLLSLTKVGSINDESGTVNNDPSTKLLTVKPGTKPFIQRRQILPKINFRYHTKDKLIVSDRLPKNHNTVTITKKNNDNLYILPDGSNAQSVIIMSPDLKTQTKNTLVRLKSPPPNNSQVKYVLNKLNANTGEIRSVTRTITTPQITVIKDKNGNTTTPQIHVMKDKNCNGKTWEKLERSTLNMESKQPKHIEMNLTLLKSQLLEREVPVYKPVDCNEYYSCLDCNDRFVLESSLRHHRFRKSVLIKYWCRTCSCCLNMYNRCMFLAHIRSHNQLIKNLDMSCLTIEPLPKSLIKFGLDDEDIDKSTPSSTSAVIKAPLQISVSQPTVCNISNDIRPSPVTSLKSVPSNNINLNNVDVGEGKQYSNISKVVQTTPKLVPSNIHNLRDSLDKGTEPANDDDVQTDVEINCKETGTADKVNHQTISTEDDDVEITVTECIQDVSESNEIISSDIVDQSNDSVEDTQLKTDKQLDQKCKSKPKGKRKCPECDMIITARYSLRKHLQNLNKPGDESLKCNVCRLILPTKCALRMHLRIHMKLKPFRCPECAIEFHIYDRFLMHLKYTCCHLTKCVRFVCTLCGNMQLSLAALEQHLLFRHVRSIFKCGSCPVAFVNAKAVEKHKEKAHPGIIVQTNSYQQCRLCPEKLIPKKKFLAHMKMHVNDEKLCIYAYQCPTCKFTFFQRTELIYHRMKCDTRDGIIKSVISSPPASPTNEVNADDVLGDDNVDKNDEDEKEMILPNKKRKLPHDDEIEIIEDETDPLSLEGFQGEEPSREPRVESCIVCKKEKVVILPGKNQSLCCKKCVRPCGAPKQSDYCKTDNRSKLQAAKMKGYKCKICKTTNFMDLKATYEHFKTYHKDLEGQSINEWLIIDNRLQNNKRSSTITTAETIKEKYNKKKKISLNSQPVIIKKEIDNDEPKEQQLTSEKKKPKRCVKLKSKVSEVKSFESGQLIVTDETEKTQFSCSKCDFVATEKEELRNHVVCHRTDPNALQCLECGECFVVLPSLEKHLIINHRISDVDSYIANNKQSVDGIPEFTEVQSDEIVKESKSDNTCRVCHEVFESKTALDKHFRSHGMAFLFKNMF